MNIRNQYKELNGKSNATGSNINYYRTKLGLSAQQLSDKLILLGLDLHRQAIFKIESGKRTVTDYELCIIAEVLGPKPFGIGCATNWSRKMCLMHRGLKNIRLEKKNWLVR